MGNASDLLRDVLGTDEPLHYSGAERYTAEFDVGRRTIRATVDRVLLLEAEVGKIVVLTDITDRRIAEYALRTAEKLAATGKLAHLIAHEINNPLEALVNLVYLTNSSPRLADIREYLARADEELKRISRITKHSLSFHRDTEHAVSIDVGALINEVTDLYRKAATARQVCISVDAKPTLAIHGFPGQLTQVFGNLLRNATEAAPVYSQVVVRVAPRPPRRSRGHPRDDPRPRNRNTRKRAGADVRSFFHDQGAERIGLGPVGFQNAHCQTRRHDTIPVLHPGRSEWNRFRSILACGRRAHDTPQSALIWSVYT